MTFDPKDFVKFNQPKWACIKNANGVTYRITRAKKIVLSLSFSLPNTLLVPSLSNKMLSVGQTIEKLNYCALIYPNFCLFQNILTKEIIGRGTKRGGLYCMDDCSLGMANTMKHTAVKEHQIWMWHRCLGHPPFLYLKHLFPSLLSQVNERVFECETCIQAKSHRTSFPVILNKKIQLLFH